MGRGETVRTVWKFPLDQDFTEDVVLTLPPFSHVLHVGEQGGVLHMWVSLFPKLMGSEDSERRVFRVYGSGWEGPLDHFKNHLGTVQVGFYVWHVFEITQS